MARVDNRRKGMVTIVSGDGKNSGTIELMHGINEDVPAWATKEPYFKAMVLAGELSVLAKNDEPAESLYMLDQNDMPIQAVDEEGELMFDDKTGEPIFVPKEAE